MFNTGWYDSSCISTLLAWFHPWLLVEGLKSLVAKICLFVPYSKWKSLSICNPFEIHWSTMSSSCNIESTKKHNNLETYRFASYKFLELNRGIIRHNFYKESDIEKLKWKPNLACVKEKNHKLIRICINILILVVTKQQFGFSQCLTIYSLSFEGPSLKNSQHQTWLFWRQLRYVVLL